MCLSIKVNRPDVVLSEGQHEGYDFVTVHNDIGYRCGYIRVPKGHPWFGRENDTIKTTAFVEEECRSLCEQAKNEAEDVKTKQPQKLISDLQTAWDAYHQDDAFTMVSVMWFTAFVAVSLIFFHYLRELLPQ